VITGSVTYPVTQDVQHLFSAPGGVVTLYNTGPSKVYLSTLPNVKPGSGIPLNIAASVQWDAENDCFACTDVGAGQMATLLVTDNAGAINDPAVVAAAINNSGLTAAAIANAIIASGLTPAMIAAAIFNSGLTGPNIAAAITSAGLTPAAIAAAIVTSGLTPAAIGIAVPTAAAIGAAVAAPTAAAISAANASTPPSGTPTLLQLVGLASAVAVSNNAVNAWVAGAPQAAGWAVPAGKKLVLTGLVVEVASTVVTTSQPQLQIVDAATHAVIFHALSMRVAASAVSRLVLPIAPGSVVLPTGIVPQVHEMSGAVGITYDVTVNGALF
jgi:hypothetical protein